MAFDWSNFGKAASSIGNVADDFFSAPSISASDFSSAWSPSALRASDIWSGADFTPFTSAGFDFSNLWSPTELRASDIWSGTDSTPFLSNFDYGDLIAPAVDVVDSFPSIGGDYLSTWGLPDAMYGGSDDWTKSSGILNQINPDVITNIPGFGFDTDSVPTTPGAYGLTSPELTDVYRLGLDETGMWNPEAEGLYKDISFATPEGVQEFARRLTAETGDTITMPTPDGGSVTTTRAGEKDKNGKYPVKVKKTGPDGKEEQASEGKGGSGGKGPASGGGKGGLPGQGGGGLGGLGSLAALGLAAGVIDMLNKSGSSSSTAKPIPTVRNIPTSTFSVQPRVVPYGQAAASTNPALAQALGAPMKNGGLSSAAQPYLLAKGGRLDFSHGAPVFGDGNGQDDKIPALLSDGEYVIDADTVAALGDGSNKAGAQILDKFRQEIRGHKRSAPAHSIPPKAKSPLQYLKEAKNG